ncbi:TPA: hypothetical protein ACSHBY_004905, partial [Escherichia coli]|uniref:hypothetical protein n=2 Tax=Escherichia coli TaxID=562 RepID=UPI001BFBFBC4
KNTLELGDGSQSEPSPCLTVFYWFSKNAVFYLYLSLIYMKNDMERIKRIPRSVHLTPELDEKLRKLSEILGVSMNSYLLNEVGKAINRDFLAYRVAESQQEVVERFYSNLEKSLEMSLVADDLNTKAS